MLSSFCKMSGRGWGVGRGKGGGVVGNGVDVPCLDQLLHSLLTRANLLTVMLNSCKTFLKNNVQITELALALWPSTS